MTKKAGLYTRVSTTRQAFRFEGSLDTQLDLLKKYVELKNAAGDEPWEIIEVYREGKSAKNTDRPEYLRMMSHIRSGHINTLLCVKIDRVSRSSMDFYQLLELLEAQNAVFVSLHENWDTSAPSGRFALKITLAVAELEREQIAQRVREKTEWRKEQGFYVGGPVLGYDFSRTQRGMLVANAEEAALVRLTYETYLKCGSILQATMVLNRKGYRTKTYLSRGGEPRGGGLFFNTGISRILTNPLYISKIQDGDKLVNGKHEPLIPLDLWQRVQRRLQAQIRTRHNSQDQRQYTFYLEGILRCGQCGAMLSPRSAHGRNQKYFYYGCNTRWHQGRTACNMKDVPAPALDTKMVERLKELGEQQDYIKKLTSHASIATQYELEQLETRRQALDRQRAQLHRKLQRWSDMLTESKNHGAEKHLLKTIGEASRQDQAIEVEMQELAEQKALLKQHTTDPEAICQNLHRFSELFDAATDSEKKALVRLILHQVIWTPEEVKYAVYEQPSTDALDDLAQNSNGDGSSLQSGWYTTSQTQRTAPVALWLDPVVENGAR